VHHGTPKVSAPTKNFGRGKQHSLTRIVSATSGSRNSSRSTIRDHVFSQAIIRQGWSTWRLFGMSMYEIASGTRLYLRHTAIYKVYGGACSSVRCTFTVKVHAPYIGLGKTRRKWPLCSRAFPFGQSPGWLLRKPYLITQRTGFATLYGTSAAIGSCGQA
jgi:hypothetical protein